MKNIICATIIGFSAMTATSAFSMADELNSLTGAIHNQLKLRGVSDIEIDNLTIAQIRRLQVVLHNGDSVSEMNSQIKSIIE